MAKKDCIMGTNGDLRNRLGYEAQAVSSAERRTPGHYGGQEEVFKAFDAAELYCPRCGRAVPVVKRLFLILPDGEKFEYRCRFCGTAVGTKPERSGHPGILIK